MELPEWLSAIIGFVVGGFLVAAGKNMFSNIKNNASQKYVDDKFDELKKDHDALKKRFFSTRDRVKQIDMFITEVIPLQLKEITQKLNSLTEKQ
jgi:hypothetical protein